jgi:uncharacterized alkaline shock family protein YloU
MRAPTLTVGPAVIDEMIRLAAVEVPGVLRVGRGGPPWRRIGRPAIEARRRDAAVEVRLWVVARPGQALIPMTADIRAAVAATIERLLGLEPAAVTVVVDGVGS